MEFQLDDILFYAMNLQDQIGRGGFSTVYRGHIPEGNPYGLPAQVVAVKVSNPGRTQMFNNEIEQAPKTPQTNVLHIIGYCRNPEADTCYIILPFIWGGSLDRNYTTLTWETVLKVAKGIANGIRYFHIQDKAISDIKPANILLNEDLTPLLCDFGSVAPTGSVFDELAHTPTYEDPIARGRGSVEKDDDMFAYGLIILQLLMKQPAMFDSEKIHHRALRLYMSRRHQAKKHVLSDILMGRNKRRKHVVSDTLMEGGCSRKDAKRISTMALRLVLDPQNVQGTLNIAPPVDSAGILRRPGIQEVIELLETIHVRRGFLGRISG